MFAVSRTNLLKELRSRSGVLGILAVSSCKKGMVGGEERVSMSPSVTDAMQDVRLASAKPPNILIHHGDSHSQGRLRRLVTSIVGTANYTVYDLPLTAPPVWVDNTSLLVVSGELSAAVSAQVEKYIQQGGAVFALTSSLKLPELVDGSMDVNVNGDEFLMTYRNHSNVSCRYSGSRLRCFQTTCAEGSIKLSYPVMSKAQPPGNVPCEHGSAKDQSSHSSKVPSATLGASPTSESPPSSRSPSLPGNQCSSPPSEPSAPIPPLPCPAIVRCFYTMSGGTVLLAQLAWDVTSPEQIVMIRSLLQHELGVKCEEPTSDEVVYRAGHILTTDDADVARFRNIPPPTGACPALHLVTSPHDITASADVLPITASAPAPAQFDSQLYHRHLLTSTPLGRCLVYLPVVTSSLDVLDDRRLPHGALVVCDTQTRGRGRGGNLWLSPPGCCMLALKLQVDLNSALGQRLSWLQHMLALAVVEAVDDPSLGLKWPNDLYWAGRTKVGGVLAETSVTGRDVVCRLGVGVNLDNRAPTVCLNSLLARPVTREELLGRLLTRLESLLAVEVEDLAAMYRRRWLHERQRVTVWRDGQERKAEVAGLDEHGFLRVRCETGGEESVMPDGNSFDMTRGLILPKQNQ